MRHKKGFSHSSLPSRWLRRVGLAVILLALLVSFYGCATQRIVYTTRGTMVFVPEGVWF